MTCELNIPMQVGVDLRTTGWIMYCPCATMSCGVMWLDEMRCWVAGMCVWTTRAVLNPISYLCKNMYVAQRRALFVSLRVRGVVTMMASLYTLGRHVHNRRTNDEMLLRSHIYIYTRCASQTGTFWSFGSWTLETNFPWHYPKTHVANQSTERCKSNPQASKSCEICQLCAWASPVDVSTYKCWIPRAPTHSTLGLAWRLPQPAGAFGMRLVKVQGLRFKDGCDRVSGA